MDNINDVIKDVMGKMANQKHQLDWQSIWQEVNIFSQFTVVEKFKEGKLYINVDQAARIIALNTYKHQILEQLKQFGVKEIIFKVGKVKT